MLKYRLIFGPLMIVLLVLAAWADQALEGVSIGWLVPNGGVVPPGVIVLPVVAGLSVLGARELTTILRGKGVMTSARVNSALAFLGLLIAATLPELDASDAGGAKTGGAVAYTAVGVVLVFSLAFYSRHQRVEGMIAAAGGSLLSFAYLGAMLAFLVLIRREHAVWVLAWILLVTKACDIGAYFTGRAIGRRKLIPWLSPGKTWEGLIGGVVLSALVAWGGAAVLERGLGTPVVEGVWLVLLTGALFGLTGQVGDLLMSVLKRDAGVKDAGRWVPGFGGVLDVIDSPLLVAPVAFWWLRLVGVGG
ncbi:MAG: phosphatidate cytidylyltransferase [Planctomycetota bacterium]